MEGLFYFIPLPIAGNIQFKRMASDNSKSKGFLNKKVCGLPLHQKKSLPF